MKTIGIMICLVVSISASAGEWGEAEQRFYTNENLKWTRADLAAAFGQSQHSQWGMISINQEAAQKMYEAMNIYERKESVEGYPSAARYFKIGYDYICKKENRIDMKSNVVDSNVWAYQCLIPVKDVSQGKLSPVLKNF